MRPLPGCYCENPRIDNIEKTRSRCLKCGGLYFKEDKHYQAALQRKRFRLRFIFDENGYEVRTQFRFDYLWSYVDNQV